MARALLAAAALALTGCGLQPSPAPEPTFGCACLFTPLDGDLGQDLGRQDGESRT